MMARRAGIGGVATGVMLVLAAYGTAQFASPTSPIGAWLMISGVSLLMGAIFLLPASGRGRWGTAVGVSSLLLVVFAAAFVSAVDQPGDRLFGGFPFRVALIVYGVAVLPTLILPALHARLFQSDGLDPESLSRLREDCSRLRGEA